MKYVTFTSEHHDGFAIFKNKAEKLNAVPATHFGCDVALLPAETCCKYGLKFGLYYSQESD